MPAPHKSAFELLAAGGALDNIVQERRRQDAKWGLQSHNPAVWLAIAMEEVGELAQAINETMFDNGPEARALGGYQNMRREAVQAAAVLVSLIEDLDRKHPAEAKGNRT